MHPPSKAHGGQLLLRRACSGHELAIRRLGCARLGYTHNYDLKQGWDRGYGEFELSRDIVDAGVKLVLLYRKGRTAPLFENERTLIFGIGISR